MTGWVTCTNASHGVARHMTGSASAAECLRIAGTSINPRSRRAVQSMRLSTDNQTGSDRPELLAHLATLTTDRPDIIEAGVIRNNCGPVSMAVAEYLRSKGLQAGVVHVFGSLTPHPDSAVAKDDDGSEYIGTAHYIVSTPGAYVDLSYRQFDPGAPTVIITEAAEYLDSYSELHPWGEEDGRIEYDEPLDPKFATYGETDGGYLMSRVAT